jgi:hypothetical protein
MIPDPKGKRVAGSCASGFVSVHLPNESVENPSDGNP